MGIEQYIPFGRENAVTREMLRVLTGKSDRMIREEIEQARREGHIIINNQDGKGYFRTDDIDEIGRQYQQNKRRALSILSQQKYMRLRLKAAGREV